MPALNPVGLTPERQARHTLDEHGDTDFSGKSVGYVPKWNGTQWVAAAPGSLSVSLDDLTDVILTAPAAGQYLRYDGTYWRNVSARGGAGTIQGDLALSAADVSPGTYPAGNFALTGGYTFTASNLTFGNADTATIRGLFSGGGYNVALQHGVNPSMDSVLGQNLYLLNGSPETWKWRTTHATFGSRGIGFSYSPTLGIEFFADNAATTADTAFTRTRRMLIRNDGFVGIGSWTPSGTEKLRVNGAAYLDGSLQVQGSANAIGSGMTTAAYAILRVGGNFAGDGTYARAIQIGPTITGAVSSTYYALTVQDNINAPGGTIAERGGLFIANPNVIAGTITTNYGLYVAGQTAGTTNWAVYTAGTTPSFFGGPITAAGYLKRGSTSDALQLSGDNDFTHGAVLWLMGGAHATAANDVRVYANNIARLVYDDSATTWYFGSYAGTVAVVTGALTASGLITGNAGVAIASGQTLGLSGVTVTGLTAASVGAGTFPGSSYAFSGWLQLANYLTIATGEVTGDPSGKAEWHFDTTLGATVFTGYDAATARGWLFRNKVGGGVHTTQFAISGVGVVTVGAWQGTAITDGYIASSPTWNAKIGGSGTVGTIAKFTATGTIGNSSLTEAGGTSLVTVGTITTGTWNAGAVTANPGTTPADALVLDIASLVAAGTRDSHYLRWTGKSFDTSSHQVDWRAFADVTANAGTSTWTLQSRVDAAAFASRLTVTDTGVIQTATWNGAVIGAAFGGTGISNSATITLAGASNVSISGAFTTTGGFTLQLTTTAATSVTLPTSGTLWASGTALSATTAAFSSTVTVASTYDLWRTGANPSFDYNVAAGGFRFLTAGAAAATITNGIWNAGAVTSSAAVTATTVLMVATGRATTAPVEPTEIYFDTTTNQTVFTSYDPATGRGWVFRNKVGAAAEAPRFAIDGAGTVTQGGWQGSAIGPSYGGTGQSTIVLGQLLYGTTGNAWALLAGNITTTPQVLMQTGTGSVSAAPTWHTLVTADITDLASASTGITKIGTLTVGAVPWTLLTGVPSLVNSVAGRSGTVTLTAADIGAGTFPSGAGFYLFPAADPSSRSGLGIGGQYLLTLQHGISNQADALIGQNVYALYNGSGHTYKWVTTHGSYGSRGIHLQFGATSGIEFFADSAATTADTIFTPTVRMLIRNDGFVGIATTTPTGSEKFRVNGGAAFDGLITAAAGLTVTTGSISATGIPATFGETIAAGHATVSALGYVAVHVRDSTAASYYPAISFEDSAGGALGAIRIGGSAAAGFQFYSYVSSSWGNADVTFGALTSYYDVDRYVQIMGNVGLYLHSTNLQNNPLVLKKEGSGGIDFYTGLNGASLLRAQILQDGDFKLATAGQFDNTTAPLADQLWVYNGTASKWQPQTIQLGVNAGIAFGQTWATGTAAYFSTHPTLDGTAIDPAAAPVVRASYHGCLVDMSATLLPPGCVYAVACSDDGGASWSGDLEMTSNRFVHSRLDPGKTYKYKYRIHGTAYSPGGYSAASTGVTPAANTDSVVYGLLAADQIVAVNLAAIVADLGTITAGRIQDKASSPKYGMLLSGAWVGGTPSVAYLDFTATGTSTWLYAPGGALTVDASGNLVSKGDLRVELADTGIFARVTGVLANIGGSNQPDYNTNYYTHLDFTLPANALVNVGDSIRITCLGRVHGTNGGTGSLIVQWAGGTSVTVSGTLASGIDSVLRLEVVIVKTGTNTQQVAGQKAVSDGGLAGTVTFSSAAASASEGSAQHIKVQSGLGSSHSETFYLDSATIEFLAA